MIDAEVIRLRRLRNMALRVRALAEAMASHPVRRDSVFSRSGRNCWRIARLITGTLRAHPYLSYQRGPSEVRAAYDKVSAGLLGGIAQYRGRSLQVFSTELQRVARELDDTRALTWSADLSDALGRSQTQIRRLVMELNCAARKEAGSHRQAVPQVELRTAGAGDAAGGAPGHWPYLAF
jgi:hypothetical protein